MSKFSRRRQGGFIIFFGWRSIAMRDKRPPIQANCPRCGEETTMMGKVLRRWFTLFFIPVIPISGGQPVTQCQKCKTMFTADLEQYRQRAEGATATTPAAGNPWQQAITLFNEMRETPADAAKLLGLMKLYQTMGEYREAAAAAQTFPEAFAADPACAAVLRDCELRQATGAVNSH